MHLDKCRRTFIVLSMAQGGPVEHVAQGVKRLEKCICGVDRRQFWLWSDTQGGIHASSFRPTSGAIRSVIAATARDALLPLSPVSPGRLPKHRVEDAENPSLTWEGRCSASLA
jgi:hypothetical protein